MGISFQESFDYRKAIRDIGCEYLCCLAMAAHLTQKGISSYSINDIWDQLVSENLANKRDGLHDRLSYYRTFDLIFNYLHLDKYHGDQIGQIVHGTIRYWGWVAEEHFNYVIRRMITGSGTRHSVLLNQDLTEIYNPAPEYPGGKTVGIYLFHVDDHPLHTHTSY